MGEPEIRKTYSAVYKDSGQHVYFKSGWSHMKNFGSRVADGCTVTVWFDS